MAAEPSRPDAPEPTAETAEVSAEQLSKAAEFIEEEEGAFSHFPGLLATATKFLLVAMSLFHLYAAVDIVPANVLRPVHVGFDAAAGLPAGPGLAALPQPADVVGRRLRAARRSPPSRTCSPAATSSGTATPRRAPADAFFGVAFVLLVLEACRRTSGWIMPCS